MNQQATPSPITSGDALTIARDTLSRILSVSDDEYACREADTALAITEATSTPSGEIATWQERRPKFTQPETCIRETQDAMEAEIADLRAALAQRASAPDDAVELYQYRTKPDWDERYPWSNWEDCTKESFDDYKRVPRLHNWRYEVRALAVVTSKQPADGGAA